MTTEATVTRTLVPENRRLAVTAELFGTWFPTRIAPVVFSLAERLSGDCKGGYWDFQTLSNGGFYIAPTGDRPYHVLCENQFEGDGLRRYLPPLPPPAGPVRRRLGRMGVASPKTPEQAVSLGLY